MAAQATTLGKRFANAGEEILQAYHRVNELIVRYPLRGIKGPVGTQQDQLDLLDGDLDRLDQLEVAVARYLSTGERRIIGIGAPRRRFEHLRLFFRGQAIKDRRGWRTYGDRRRMSGAGQQASENGKTHHDHFPPPDELSHAVRRD